MLTLFTVCSLYTTVCNAYSCSQCVQWCARYNHAMAKSKRVFTCGECGARYSQYKPYCPKCDSYGTIEETAPVDAAAPAAGVKVNTRGASDYTPSSSVMSIRAAASSSSEAGRTATGIGEFDRLMQGGFVPGQVVLIGAEPGFGKSTLCMEIAGGLAVDHGWDVLYASGEESASQIASRAERLGVESERIHLVSTTTVEDVLAHAGRTHARCVIVDSLQTMATSTITGSLGSISQSKEAAVAFKQYAKDNTVVFILISQFNKNDEVAGSNQIAHIVDTILVGDADHETTLKFLRSQKNRYGRTDEVAVFVHTDDGLMSVSDPSEFLIGDVNELSIGSARTFMRTGARLLPVEIDSLVNGKPVYGTPQKQFSGVPFQRGRIILAAVEKYVHPLKVRPSDTDVFVSTLNGVNADDTTTDLAVAASIVSSIMDRKPQNKTAWVGEVALTGRILGKSLALERVREAERMGFDRIVMPMVARSDIEKTRVKPRITVQYITRLDEIIHLV